MAGHGAAKHWWERDTTPGYILIAATIVSFILLNGPAGEAFHHLLEDQIGGLSLGFGEGAHALNLHLIINDALMVIFFLYVGLELKRETVEGPFKNPREAALPMAGAVGGMAALPHPGALHPPIDCVMRDARLRLKARRIREL